MAWLSNLERFLSRRRPMPTILAVGLLAALLLAVAAAAASSGPNLTLVALAPADVGGGARVVRQHGLRSPGYEAAFERELEFGSGAVGGSTLFYLTSTIELARVADTAKADIDAARAALATREGRVAVVKAMQNDLRRTLGKSLKAAAMGTIRFPAIGAGAVVVPIAVTTTGGRLQVVVTYVRVDRLLATMTFVGSPVTRADLDRLLRLTAEKARIQLAPISVSPPSIAGPAVAGQRLVASSGSWTNGTTSFAYRWSRCDGAGAGCVSLAGATLPSYTLTATDVGFTLRVAVTARNGAGKTTALSPQTAVVVAAA
jgi:hypothetical protein